MTRGSPMPSFAIPRYVKVLGQFLLYRSILEEQDPERRLFLAVPGAATEILDEPIGTLLNHRARFRSTCTRVNTAAEMTRFSLCS